MPSAAPAALTAVPSTTANIGSPSRSAASSGLSANAKAPSDRMYPFASASKEWHLPSGLMTPRALKEALSLNVPR